MCCPVLAFMVGFCHLFCTFVLIGYAIYRNILNRIHLRNQLRYKEIEQEKAEELNHAKHSFHEYHMNS